jgi:hypothetical protein
MSKPAAVMLAVIVTFLVTSACWLLAGLLFVMVVSNNFTSDLSAEDFNSEFTAPPFQVRLDYPDDVAAGDEFDLVVHVRNLGETAQVVDSIDLDASLLEGLEVVASDPFFTEREDFGSYESFYFTYSLEGAEAAMFTITLRARQRGVFTGDIDVCDQEVNFITLAMGMRVK